MQAGGVGVGVGIVRVRRRGSPCGFVHLRPHQGPGRERDRVREGWRNRSIDTHASGDRR